MIVYRSCRSQSGGQRTREQNPVCYKSLEAQLMRQRDSVAQDNNLHFDSISLCVFYILLVVLIFLSTTSTFANQVKVCSLLHRSECSNLFLIRSYSLTPSTSLENFKGFLTDSCHIISHSRGNSIWEKTRLGKNGRYSQFLQLSNNVPF